MTAALQRGEWSAARAGRTLPPGKTRYPLYRSLCEPQGRYGQSQKISPPPRFDPRTVQLVASRHTDYATRPTISLRSTLILPARLHLGLVRRLRPSGLPPRATCSSHLTLPSLVHPSIVWRAVPIRKQICTALLLHRQFLNTAVTVHKHPRSQCRRRGVSRYKLLGPGYLEGGQGSGCAVHVSAPLSSITVCSLYK